MSKSKKEGTSVAEEVKEVKKVKILLSPCGFFGLPYNVGQVVELPANVAEELVEAKYAEFV